MTDPNDNAALLADAVRAFNEGYQGDPTTHSSRISGRTAAGVASVIAFLATRPAVDTPDLGGVRNGVVCACKARDAWRCAVSKRLTHRITCDCLCHTTPPPTPDAVPSGQGVGEDDAWCGECGVKLENVRPGKHQHPACSAALQAALTPGAARDGGEKGNG